MKSAIWEIKKALAGYDLKNRLREFFNLLKDGALSAFLPPVGRRSFRSCKLNAFLYSEQLCCERISLITNNKILKRLFNLIIFGKTQSPFNDISMPCVNVNKCNVSR